MRRDKSHEPVVHQVAKRYIFNAVVMGGLITIVLLTAGWFWVAQAGPSSFLKDSISNVLVTLAFVPSLAFLLVGISALIAALFAKRSAAHRRDPITREEMAAGVRLALRIAGLSLVYSTAFGLIGYVGTIYIFRYLSG
jgi:hypothetical protein